MNPNVNALASVCRKKINNVIINDYEGVLKTFVRHLHIKTCKKRYMTHAKLYVCSCCCYLIVVLLYRQVSWSRTTCCVQLSARTNAALLSHDLKLLKVWWYTVTKVENTIKKQASDVTLC